VKSESKQIQNVVPFTGSLNVGLTYDTRDDFKFVSDEPDDWDVDLTVSTSIDDIAHAIEDLGHRAVYIGSGMKLVSEFGRFEKAVDIVFNICEGYYGRAREAQVPAVLELAGVPFVGSDVYALSMAMNKWHTKVLATHYGIRTPDFQVVRDFDEAEKCRPKRFPAIAKLCYEGSAMGLKRESVVNGPGELRRLLRYLLKAYRETVLVEEFIPGKEIDVPIIGNQPERALGVVGLTLDRGLDLEDKFLTSEIVRDDRYGFRYPLKEPFVEQAGGDAVKIYNLLGCRDFGRVDMRIDHQNRPYLLEVNPLPFLGKHSSFNEIARKTIGYTEMIGLILNSALERQQLRKRV
jgi:D-alanine-D-alanine ligase